MSPQHRQELNNSELTAIYKNYRFQFKFVSDQAHTIAGQTLTGFAGFCRIEAGKNLTPPLPLKSSHKYQSSQRCKSGVGTLIQL